MHNNWLMPLGVGLKGSLPNPLVAPDESSLAIGQQVFSPRNSVNVTATTVGGGGGSFSKFESDSPPTSPSALDDEFNSTALSGIWTQVNWQSGGANMTYDVNTTVPGALYFQGTTTGATTHRCLLQSIPAGDFTIQMEFAFQYYTAGLYQYIGLWLTDGTTNGAGNQYCTALVQDNWAGSGGPSFRWYTQVGTNFSNFSSTLNGPWIYWDQHAHLRIRRSGTSFFFAISPDGRQWQFEYGGGVLGHTPTFFGIGFLNSGAAIYTAAIKHFRYSTSATAKFGNMVNYVTV